MKVLVTGGAGYIGSHVVQMLTERDYQVVVFDNLIKGNRAAVHPDASLIVGDLHDRAALARLFKAHQFDGIMHFASQILVAESMRQPFDYLRDNLYTFINLLECASQHSIKRFILSSTANLYDQPERVPIDEGEALTPGSIYGETKYVAERLLAWMDRLYGIKYCCLRYFNACGAHPDGHIGEAHDPESHLIPLVLQVALGQREAIEIYGADYDTPDGTCIRDYVHVLDLARAHILALEALADGESRVYNLGSGSGYSVREVIEAARKVTGRPISAIVAPRRPGDLPILVADSEKIGRELGWETDFNNLETIIDTAWNWHRRHPRGFES
ncbi:MAG: UDP-glucose 4-epimerase GalE [Chloroflexota bacterium]|nr:UDP-glucose 4-epimerase GalE [Chloroflexota bacterium]MDE2909553.1 UDP-glucose 4-epimerase GalE [Chloroflexota bacterium]